MWMVCIHGRVAVAPALFRLQNHLVLLPSQEAVLLFRDRECMTCGHQSRFTILCGDNDVLASDFDVSVVIAYDVEFEPMRKDR